MPRDEKKKSKSKAIVFCASLPPIQSAISLDGMGDGGRIKLDVSCEYVNALLELQKLSGKNLIVHIVAADNVNAADDLKIDL